MLAEELTPGMRVRYPRTGTTGNILRIESSGKAVFAELDSTHLLYRVDQLIPAPVTEKISKTIVKDTKTIVKDTKTIIAREREFAAGSELQEAIKNIDQSCEGGG